MPGQERQRVTEAAPSGWQPTLLVVATILAGAGGAPRSVAAEPSAADAEASARRALAVLQPYIGPWRGVGQPRRGSNRGAWSEKSDWAWQFAATGPAVVFESPEGKFYRSGQITVGQKPGTLLLVAKRPNDQGTDRFQGRSAGDTLVFERAADGADAGNDPTRARPNRITLRLVADGKRLVALFEGPVGGAAGRMRLAEVGYTRVGSEFAVAGAAGPECVVTGGLGTIAVEHEGKTYYVCCGGCRDLFAQDPAGVLADYQARRQAAGKK